MNCGYLIAAYSNPTWQLPLRGLYGAQIPGQLTLRPAWWIAGIAISILGVWPRPRRALPRRSVFPYSSCAAQAWQHAQQRWLRLQGALALIVFATAIGFLWFGDSLVSGFGVLAALLLGAALGLPVVLGFALYLGQRSARRPLAAWFWADSRQQLSGLSLALMALLLALAVNVGVSTMVESFSKTFSGWLTAHWRRTSISMPPMTRRQGDQGLAAPAA